MFKKSVAFKVVTTVLLSGACCLFLSSCADDSVSSAPTPSPVAQSMDIATPVPSGPIVVPSTSKEDTTYSNMSLTYRMNSSKLEIYRNGDLLKAIENAEAISVSPMFLAYRTIEGFSLMYVSGKELYHCFSCTFQVNNSFALAQDTYKNVSKGALFSRSGKRIFEYGNTADVVFKLNDTFASFHSSSSSALFHYTGQIKKSCENMSCDVKISNSFGCVSYGDSSHKTWCYARNGEEIEWSVTARQVDVLDNFLLIQYQVVGYVLYHKTFGLITRTSDQVHFYEITDDKISMMKVLSPSWKTKWSIDKTGAMSESPL